MLNFRKPITPDLVVQPSERLRIERSLYWCGTDDTIFIIPFLGFYADEHPNMPVLNIQSGCTITLGDMLEMPGIRPAGGCFHEIRQGGGGGRSSTLLVSMARRRSLFRILLLALTTAVSSSGQIRLVGWFVYLTVLVLPNRCSFTKCPTPTDTSGLCSL